VHHGDADSSPQLENNLTAMVAFRWRLFAYNITQFIHSNIYPQCNISNNDNNVRSNSVKGKKIFVIQTGSWDINNLPLRYILEDEHAYREMVRAILKVIESPQCHSNGVYIILLGTPLVKNINIVWRNKFAVTAMNEYFRRAFQDFLTNGLSEIIIYLLMPCNVKMLFSY